LLGFGFAIQANHRLLCKNYKSDLSNNCDRLFRRDAEETSDCRGVVIRLIGKLRAEWSRKFMKYKENC
jgi:hypothetical protein